jgi:hypothetical protein
MGVQRSRPMRRHVDLTRVGVARAEDHRGRNSGRRKPNQIASVRPDMGGIYDLAVAFDTTCTNLRRT